MNVEAYENRSSAYLQLGKPKEAINDVTWLLEKNPRNAGAYLNLGLAYYALKQYEQALEMYKKVTELAPGNHSAYLNNGAVYLRMRRFDDALMQYNKAHNLAPKNVSIYVSRGLLNYAHLNQREAGISDMQKALALAPGSKIIAATLKRMEAGKKVKTEGDHYITPYKKFKFKKIK
jgi:tetratricopeptide (TPR) repeat protein